MAACEVAALESTMERNFAQGRSSCEFDSESFVTMKFAVRLAAFRNALN